VLVTYEAQGTYGHPDHIRAHQITVAAFEAAGDPERFSEAGPAWRPDKLYYIVRPRSRTEALLRAAREAGLEGLFGARTEEAARERLERFATPDEDVTTEVEIGPYYDQKRAAILAHRTQMGPKSFFQQMPVELGRRFGTHEYFQRAAGPAPEAAGDRETDLFAGL
jgi:LmbE family N-acetylglucosaminyl deacetylase